MQQGALAFDFSQQYLYQEQLYGLDGRPAAAAQPTRKGDAHVTDTAGDDTPSHHGPQWVLLRFSQPVTAPAVGHQPCLSCYSNRDQCQQLRPSHGLA
jgi:hypothetical protein